MTPRQKEFIRHYLSGMAAPDAAVAAGYARSTAEANAKAILSSKAVAAKLTELRIRSQEPHRQAIAQAITQLQDIIATEADTRLRLIAIRELRGWCRQLERLGPPTTLLDEVLGPLTNPTNTSAKSVANSWENNENDDEYIDNQHLDAEIKKSNVVQGLQPFHARQAGVHACTHTDDQVPEVDHLRDETDAADIRLSPRKPTPPKRPPTVITFRLPDSTATAASLERPSPPTLTAASLKRPD